MAVETRLYDLLGVAPDASTDEIKKAYRKQALKHHPDKGGNQKTFQEITAAHDVLSNEEKRQIYDEYGEDGLYQSTQSESGRANDMAGSLFSLFFGKNGPFHRSSGNVHQRKSSDASLRMAVSLEDLYNGATKRIQISRTVVCDKCKGSGATVPDAESACPACQGTGVQEMRQRMGTSMLFQQVTCTACQGSGRSIPLDLRCEACHGYKTQVSKKILEVNIPRGCSEKNPIVLVGEADHLPGLEAGDVIIHLQVKPHARFKRSDDHLLVLEEVTLAEALCGCTKELVALDGRILASKRNLVRSLSLGAGTVYEMKVCLCMATPISVATSLCNSK